MSRRGRHARRSLFMQGAARPVIGRFIQGSDHGGEVKAPHRAGERLVLRAEARPKEGPVVFEYTCGGDVILYLQGRQIFTCSSPVDKIERRRGFEWLDERNLAPRRRDNGRSGAAATLGDFPFRPAGKGRESENRHGFWPWALPRGASPSRFAASGDIRTSSASVATTKSRDIPSVEIGRAHV